MQTDLIQMAEGYLGPDVAARASALVGESPATTGKALDAGIRAVVGGLAGETSSPGGAERLAHVLREAGFARDMGGLPERLAGKGFDEIVALGKDLLRRVLGGRAGTAVDAAARSSGVAPSTMETLMGLATPVVLGVLGSRGLDARGLAELLAAQPGVTPGAAATATATAPPSATRTLPPVAAPLRSSAGGAGLWLLLLVLVPAVVLGVRLTRFRGGPLTTHEGASGPATAEVPAASAAPAHPLGADAAELTQFLDGSRGEPTRRFVFDNMSFEFAGTNLTPRSVPTLDAVAAALKAHPNARVVLEGHTDSVGAPAANARLSFDRAEAIKSALVARGVAADRITTRGFGQEQPAASNDTPEGRAQNRRTEIVVTR
jgi:outer membrane protein OmpA-like peptidoglycan-associated protein